MDTHLFTNVFVSKGRKKMKLGRVRAGERFVFDHVGGVYQKVSPEKARCIYGKHFGKEEPITPDISVYVIFEDRNKLKKIGDVSHDPTDCSAGVVNTAAVQEPAPTPAPVADEREWDKSLVDKAHQRADDELSKHLSESPAPVQAPAPAIQEGTMQIMVIDENDNCLLKIPNATTQQVVAFSKAEGVRLEKNGKGKIIREAFYDYTESTYIVVLGGKYD